MAKRLTVDFNITVAGAVHFGQATRSRVRGLIEGLEGGWRQTEAQVKSWKSTLNLIAAAGAAMAAMLAPIANAEAQARRPRPQVYAELPPVEGRGCYYDRGEEFCGSYCYWEINGKRYCQRRLRDAHSQAGPEHFFYAEPRPGAYEYRFK